MPDEIEVSCPNCSVVFSVPGDLCGELAECSECNSVFEIPFPEGSKQLDKTETGAIKGSVIAETENVDTTNTVKLSRTGIGMIPTLKESFEFGTKAPPPPRGGPLPAPGAQKPAAPPPPPAMQKVAPPPPPPQAASAPAGKTAPSMKKPAQFKVPGAATAPPPPPAPQPQAGDEMSQTATAIAPPATPVQLPQWISEAVKISKDETVVAVAENKLNIFVKALLISLPAILSFAAVIKGIGIIFAVLAFAGTFGVAFALLNQDAKRAVVLTTQRAISLVGKNRYEAKP